MSSQASPRPACRRCCIRRLARSPHEPQGLPPCLRLDLGQDGRHIFCGRFGLGIIMTAGKTVGMLAKWTHIDPPFGVGGLRTVEEARNGREQSFSRALLTAKWLLYRAIQKETCIVFLKVSTRPPRPTPTLPLRGPADTTLLVFNSGWPSPLISRGPSRRKSWLFSPSKSWSRSSRSSP